MRRMLVDPEGLGKPPVFSGKEEHFYVWTKKVENYVSGVFPNVRGALAFAAESQEVVTSATVAICVPELGVETSAKIDAQLFVVLSALTEGESRNMANTPLLFSPSLFSAPPPPFSPSPSSSSPFFPPPPPSLLPFPPPLPPPSLFFSPPPLFFHTLQLFFASPLLFGIRLSFLGSPLLFCFALFCFALFGRFFLGFFFRAFCLWPFGREVPFFGLFFHPFFHPFFSPLFFSPSSPLRLEDTLAGGKKPLRFCFADATADRA